MLLLLRLNVGTIFMCLFIHICHILFKIIPRLIGALLRGLFNEISARGLLEVLRHRPCESFVCNRNISICVYPIPNFKWGPKTTRITLTIYIVVEIDQNLQFFFCRLVIKYWMFVGRALSTLRMIRYTSSFFKIHPKAWKQHWTITKKTLKIRLL